MTSITTSAAASIVTSRDGTRIAYTKIGAGEPVVLVDGALCHRAFGPNAALAEALARGFAVITYDRRGRGESGDAGEYAVEREIEDLEALIDAAAGGSAHVYGISSGAALALEAAARLDSIRSLALYEAPFVVDDSRAPVPAEFPRGCASWWARIGAATPCAISCGSASASPHRSSR